MNQSLLFWIVLVLAFGAGVGVIPTVQLFRAPHPGTRAKGHEPAERPEPVAAPARTIHHDYDTLDVLDEGMRIGRGDRLPFSTDEGTGWANGSMGGRPPGREPWLSELHPSRGGA